MKKSAIKKMTAAAIVAVVAVLSTTYVARREHQPFIRNISLELPKTQAIEGCGELVSIPASVWAIAPKSFTAYFTNSGSGVHYTWNWGDTNYVSITSPQSIAFTGWCIGGTNAQVVAQAYIVACGYTNAASTLCIVPGYNGAVYTLASINCNCPTFGDSWNHAALQACY